MKRILILCVTVCTFMSAAAQSASPYFKAHSTNGTAIPRSEFFSYAIREDAEKGNIILSDRFKLITAPLSQDGGCSVRFFAPYALQDRTVMFHSDGGWGTYALYVNGRLAGTSHDSQTASEILISPYLTDGINDITIVTDANLAGPCEDALRDPLLVPARNAYIISQPLTHILDYDILGTQDSTGLHGILSLDIAVANNTRSERTFSVGYDIYDPDGKLKEYDLDEVTLAAGSVDTVRFRQPIYNTAKHLWSAEHPSLYNVMLYIKNGGKIIEYVPVKLGWGITTYTDGTLLRNGKPVQIRAEKFAPVYNSSLDGQLRTLRKKGINTIVLHYPAQIELYRAADRVGMYIVDCPNINTDSRGGDRTKSGTQVNNPTLLDDMSARTVAAFKRTRNHPSVVAWSLAGEGGNGYNLYKTYNLLHTLDTLRPVAYDAADGEWNSDITIFGTR